MKQALTLEISNILAKMDDIYNAQLHTPEAITGQNASDYLLVKSTFDVFLSGMERYSKTLLRNLESLHTDLVATASPQTARKAMDIIAGHEEALNRHDIAFEIFVSELFQMQHHPDYRTHLLEKD